MKPHVIIAFVAIHLLTAIAARSTQADIVQGESNTTLSLAFATSFGQTFTPTPNEALINTVSFKWGSSNASQPDPTITVRLRAGVGYGGPVLGSQTVTAIQDSTPDGSWIDFLFASPVAVIPGSIYSLQFTKDNEGFVSGAYRSIGNDVYVDGAFLGSTGVLNSNADLAFRVLGGPTTTSIPEASALAFGALALVLGGLSCRIKRRDATASSS